jgi:membrane dipeptidase
MKKIDSHIDIADMYKLWNYSVEDFLSDNTKPPVTLKKLQDSEIDIAGFSLYFDESFLKTTYKDGVNDFYAFYENIISKTDKLYQIKDKKSLIEKPIDKTGYFFSIEGLECIDSIDDFYEFYKKGVISYGLTWDFTNKYACSRQSKIDSGLSDLGKELLREMSKSPVIIDLAHLSENSVKDADKYFNGMIVNTHSNVRSVWNCKHEMLDEEIQIVVDRGGLISLFPLAEDTGPNGSFEDLVKHLDYVVDKWGDDYVSFTSDIYPLPEYPFLEGYTDISIMSGLEKFLLTRYPRESVEKFLYKNWYRVLNNTLK